MAECEAMPNAPDGSAFGLALCHAERTAIWCVDACTKSSSKCPPEASGSTSWLFCRPCQQVCKLCCLVLCRHTLCTHPLHSPCHVAQNRELTKRCHQLSTKVFEIEGPFSFFDLGRRIFDVHCAFRCAKFKTWWE